MEKIASSGTAKPPIHISETDYALIASQAMRLEATAPDVAEMLLDEIDRAEIHSRDELPSDVVTLGSVVTFVDESTGVRRSQDRAAPKPTSSAARCPSFRKWAPDWSALAPASRSTGPAPTGSRGLSASSTSSKIRRRIQADRRSKPGMSTCAIERDRIALQQPEPSV